MAPHWHWPQKKDTRHGEMVNPDPVEAGKAVFEGGMTISYFGGFF